MREAVRKGYQKLDEFETDFDLDPLRDDAEFKELAKVALELRKARESARKLP